MMFPGGIRCIPGYPQRVGGTQRPGDAPVRRCHPGGGLCRAEPRPPKRTAPTPRAQRGPPPAASAPPPRGGGGRWRRGRPRGSPRRRKPGPVPSRSAPGCHFKVNKAAEVRAGDGLSGGTGLRNRYRNRGRGGARVPVAAGVVLGGSFRGAPSVRPRRYRSAARSGLGGRHQEGLSGGGTRRDPPPPLPSPGPVFLRARRCGGRDGAAPPPCPVLCVWGGGPSAQLWGLWGWGEGGEQQLFWPRGGADPPGDGNRRRLGHRAPPVPPPRPPSARVTPRGSGFPRCTCRGGAVSAWGCAVFVGLWLCEPGWGEALGCRAVASPPAAPPMALPPPSSPLLPALLSRCRCKHLQLSFGSELTAKQN